MVQMPVEGLLLVQSEEFVLPGPFDRVLPGRYREVGLLACLRSCAMILVTERG